MCVHEVPVVDKEKEVAAVIARAVVVVAGHSNALHIQNSMGC